MPKVTWSQDEYEESAPRNFDPVPKGAYVCIIDDIEEKQTKKKDGTYFEIVLHVDEKGEFKGRKLWARLNVHNPSEMAERIGREQFKALCSAAGKPGVQKTEMLHGKKVTCFVSIKQGDSGPMNQVDGFAAPEARADSDDEDDEKPLRSPTRNEASTSARNANARKKTGIGEDDIPF